MPGPISVLHDVTAPYSGFEAWAYDRFVGAVAAERMAQALEPTLAALAPDATVLDVGCGGGHQLVQIAGRRPGLRLRGLDLSPAQIARAQLRLRPLGAEATVGTALDLPFPDESFDAVISVASIKHWPDPRRGLTEAVRVLKPGGRLCFTEVDRGAAIDDARAFFSALPVPRPLRPLAFPIFRTFVLGQGWDLDEARGLADGLRMREVSVARAPGVPVVGIYGVK
jgi:ubiquinone/menaquinone biosynthesis C-methylase UbiE